MKTLERYIIKRILGLSLAYLSIATLLSWIIEMLGKLDFLLVNSQSLAVSLYFSVLFLPPTIALMLPFAFLFACAQTLSTMHSDSELVALHASGLSVFTLARPIVIAALLFCSASFYLANYLTPAARLTMRQVVAEVNANFLSIALKEGEFQKLSDHILVSAAKRNANGQLDNFLLIDQRHANKILYYYATKAYIAQQNKQAPFLVLTEGQIAQKTRNKAQTSLLGFHNYTLDLSEFFSIQKTPKLYPKDRYLSFLWNPDPKDKNYQNAILPHHAELHKRLTEWLLPLMFGFICINCLAFPRPYRQSIFIATSAAIFFSLAYYALNYFLITRAQTISTYIFAVYLVIVIQFLGHGLYFFYRGNCKTLKLWPRTKKRNGSC